MCILCVIQKWSRRVATMLPWLVIPLIGLWAFSQLLPPAFRFEITSPRLACVFVLLVTLFWYEILMPHLSSWRAHRNARLRERKRVEAIELQKLRKTATKRCRNCLTPYKDQNPGGGRFMCSYCGHISKRPVLDVFLPTGFSNSRMNDLIGKSGKIMNGKTWTDSGWIHGQDWLENRNWSSGAVVGMSSYWRKNGNNIFEGDENCFAEKSYSCVVIFVFKLLASFFVSIQWLWRKIFGFSSTTEDFSSDTEHQGTIAKSGENGMNFQESKGEKARRKAEEKRQARLEKELLDEEERKQREEVARLVEEQRRLRDEKAEAERYHAKTSFQIREKDSKKESEKRRPEKRKEKDRGSSKSNSDAEELEKRAGKESEKKCDFDRKSDHRETQRSEGAKGQGTEIGYVTKNNAANNFDGSNARNRYFDCMRGSIWSSSKAFSGGNIFVKISSNATTANKEEKSLSSIERVHTSNTRKDMCPQSEQPVKHTAHVGDKSDNCHVLINQQPRTSPKKSPQQLFTRSLPVPPTTNVSVISRPTPKSQPEVYSPPFNGQSASPLSFESSIIFGQHAPFTLSTYPTPSASTSLGFSPAIEPIFCPVQEMPLEHVTEEPELFEDPCYIPDPVSLLGPVSESLENFQLDKGTGFGIEIGGNRPIASKHAWVSTEVNKPSPIVSPLSREKHNSYPFRTISKDLDLQTLPIDDVNTGAKEEGTWQMWNSSPLGQDALGLVGGPASWLLPLECNRSSKDDFILPSSQKTMASLFKKDDQVLSRTLTHHNVVGSGQGDGTFSSVTGCKHDPWLKKAVFPPISCTENHYALKPPEETTHSDIIYGSPRTSVINHPFEPSQAHCWSKIEQNLQSSGEGTGKPYVLRPSVGGLFPTPDIESLWSFDSVK